MCRVEWTVVNPAVLNFALQDWLLVVSETSTSGGAQEAVWPKGAVFLQSLFYLEQQFQKYASFLRESNWLLLSNILSWQQSSRYSIQTLEFFFHLVYSLLVGETAAAAFKVGRNKQLLSLVLLPSVNTYHQWKWCTRTVFHSVYTLSSRSQPLPFPPRSAPPHGTRSPSLRAERNRKQLGLESAAAAAVPRAVCL